MSTSIPLSVGNLSCFTTFISMIPNQILNFPYTCLFTFCKIIMTGEPKHAVYIRMEPGLLFHLNACPNYKLLK